MAHQTPAKQLFELLVTKDFDPECLDAVGKPCPNPAETEVFSFDYTAESGNDYGTVVVMLADDNDLQVYFGDNLGKGMEGEDKTQWFDFLYALKHFATKNLMSFSPKNLNRLRYSMQGQAAIKEGLFESWTGTRTQSWNGVATEARLMIKHKRPLGENDARFRYVESLFIETAEGERYKLPFTKLSGGRAMVEHVRNGGKVYDARGQHITEMVTELNVLSRFRRANHGKIFEGDTAQLVEETTAYYETLQRSLKSLSTNRGYSSYFESWQPNEITEQDVVIEGLKHLFVTQSLDTRIEDALPLLAKIREQGTAMKEANIFEAWVDNLAEGTWSTPDTPEKQQQLIDLLSKEFPVGPDATNATEQLYNLIGDDELFDQLEALAEQNPDADCRQVVMDRMDMLSDDPDVRAVIDQIQIEPEATMNPAAPTDVAASATPEEPPVPTMESISLNDIRRNAGLKLLAENVTLDEDGSTLQHILNTFKRDVKDFKTSGEMSQHLHDALYDYYFDDMPYGVQKARTGDPYEWVSDRFGADLGLSGYGRNSPGIGSEDDPSLEREGVDYATEENLENVTSIGGDSSDELMADVMTNQQGTDVNEEGLPEEKLCNMTEAGESCPMHGVEECWGTAGMAPAGGATLESTPDPVLERMREIAGLKKKVTDEEQLNEFLPVLAALGAGAMDAIGAVGRGIGTAASAVGRGVGAAADEVGGVVGDYLKGPDGAGGMPPPSAIKIGAEMHKPEDDTEEPNEALTSEDEKGKIAGSLIGTAIAPELGPVGGIVGGVVGDKLGDKVSALKGKYGHSGKMEAVAENTDFLTRLKELSGMMRSDKI